MVSAAGVKGLLKVLTLRGLALLFRLRKLLSFLRPAPPGPPRSVLVVETALLGDVAAATPLIRRLRQRLPEARLEALVLAGFRPLLQASPHLDGLRLVESTSPLALLRLGRSLRRPGYDAVVCASPGVRNSLLALTIGRRLVMGYLAWPSLKPYYYQDHRVEVIGGRGRWRYGKDQHLVTRAELAAAPLLGPPGAPTPPEIHLEPAAEARTLARLKDEGLLRKGACNLVVHPGGSNPQRHWPARDAARVLAGLRRRGGGGGRELNPVLVGVGREGELCRAIAEQAGGAGLFLDRGLEELLVLLKHADAFLGTDSGPKFLADAFAKPMVVLHGPQLPATVGPLNPRARGLYRQLDCNPCPQTACPHQGKCVKAITPEEVLAALGEVLPV